MTTSTINTSVPAPDSQLLSAPVRGNFQAAANDINALWNAVQTPSGDVSNATATSTAATVAQTLATHFNYQMFAEDFGAVGDGVTDDTAAIQLALNTMFTTYPNGSKLMFRRGTYIATQITIHRQQILCSADGVQACILMQKAGSNRDFIISENFAALTGTGAVYHTNPLVPSWFGIQDMHIDGNASAQASGRGIAWYGNAQLMLGNNLIQNCKSDNIYTEASGQFPYNATAWQAEVEGFFDHVISQGSGRYGWLFRGPYDSVIIDYIGHENTSTSFRNEQSVTLINGQPIYLGNCHIHSIHTYDETDHTGQYYGAETTILECETDFDNITLAAPEIKINKLTQIGAGYGSLNALEITSAAVFCTIALHSLDFYSAITNVIGVNVQSGGGNLTIDNSQTTYVPGTSGITLYKIRSNFVTINAICSNASGAGSIGWDINAEYCKFTGMMSNCTTFISYVGDHNIVDMQIYTGTTGTVLTGTPDATDTFSLNVDTGFLSQFRGFNANSGTYASNGYIFWNVATCMSGWNASGQIQSTFLGAEANSAYDYEAPTTGFNLTLGGSSTHMLLNPAGTLATGTVNMVAFPVNGHKVIIGTTQTITAITFAPQSGQTVRNAPTTLPAGSAVGWIYRATDTTWYPILSENVGLVVAKDSRVTAQSGAAGSVATFTNSAVDTSYTISANVNVTTYSSGTFTVTCAYTDETNTARTLTLNFSSTSGTIGTAIAAAGAFVGIPVQIRAFASSTITIATTGTFTSLVYNAEGTITKLT